MATLRAGKSPTFQDPGTPLDGLTGTQVTTRESHVGLTGVWELRYPFQLYSLLRNYRQLANLNLARL